MDGSRNPETPSRRLITRKQQQLHHNRRGQVTQPHDVSELSNNSDIYEAVNFHPRRSASFEKSVSFLN